MNNDIIIFYNIHHGYQVRVRIGSPITGYGQESRNRAARQRIPNRVWKDDEGVEHVEVTNLHFRKTRRVMFRKTHLSLKLLGKLEDKKSTFGNYTLCAFH